MPKKKRRIPVVLNTSVIISHLYGGASRKVVNLWKRGHLQLIVSPEVVEEYLRVLQKSPLLTERGIQALRLCSLRSTVYFVNCVFPQIKSYSSSPWDAF